MSSTSQNFDLEIAGTQDETVHGTNADRSPASTPAWKQELNERLAATRARRASKAAEQAPLPGMGGAQDRAASRAAQLAAKVAERYSQAPSYSEMLAIEARNVARAAEAAESAAQQARAAAHAILVGLDEPQHLPEKAPEPSSGPRVHPQPAPAPEASLHAHREHYERSAYASADEYGSALDDLIEEALVVPAEPLPANLIAFPRELVAARKARPRLAEGPLRESEGDRTQTEPQLRIFEVEAESISKTARVDARPPEWSSIRLEATSAYAEEQHAAQHTHARGKTDTMELPLETAPLEDRLMAGIVDAALVCVAFVLFVIVLAACTAHPPTGKPAVIGGAAVLAGLFVLYQVLFFTYAESTPGMRYAKIALCTFSDENPTREAMRRRILLLLLSACPLGLGFMWAWFDSDRLGWHDRLTRMYQRSYR